MILWVHLYGGLAPSLDVRGTDENECKVGMALIEPGLPFYRNTLSVCFGDVRWCRRTEKHQHGAM